MTPITSALGQATVLFGLIVVLAVLVVGFFKGCAWLDKIDDGGTGSNTEI